MTISEYIKMLNMKIFSDYSKIKSVHQISGFFFVAGLFYVLFSIYISRCIIDATPDLKDTVRITGRSRISLTFLIYLEHSICWRSSLEGFKRIK